MDVLVSQPVLPARVPEPMLVLRPVPVEVGVARVSVLDAGPASAPADLPGLLSAGRPRLLLPELTVRLEAVRGVHRTQRVDAACTTSGCPDVITV